MHNSPPKAERLVYIDNLRWCAISMVVVMHAAVTYSPFGSWYYRERPQLGLGSQAAFAAYQSLQHAVAMGLLFGIAGYFAAGMIARRGVTGFLRERAYRLGLPLLLFLIVIGPLTEYYVAGSWRSRPPRSFPEEWLHHLWTGKLFSGSGPLWFCLVLLMFSGCFASLATVHPVSHKPEQPLPNWLSVAILVLSVTVITFFVGLWAKDGTTILNVSVHDFPQYPFMFVAGILAWRGGWLRKLPPELGRQWLGLSLLCSLMLWSAIVVFGGALQGDLASYAGGWHWQALAMDFWRAGTCIAMSVGLVTLFRDAFDVQGRFTRFLSRSAFGVYVFHAPVLIAITRALHEWSIIPQLKFLIASVLGVVASFAIVGLVVRRTPLLRAIV